MAGAAAAILLSSYLGFMPKTVVHAEEIGMISLEDDPSVLAAQSHADQAEIHAENARTESRKAIEAAWIKVESEIDKRAREAEEAKKLADQNAEAVIRQVKSEHSLKQQEIERKKEEIRQDEGDAGTDMVLPTPPVQNEPLVPDSQLMSDDMATAVYSTSSTGSPETLVSDEIVGGEAEEADNYEGGGAMEAALAAEPQVVSESEALENEDSIITGELVSYGNIEDAALILQNENIIDEAEETGTKAEEGLNAETEAGNNVEEAELNAEAEAEAKAKAEAESKAKAEAEAKAKAEAESKAKAEAEAKAKAEAESKAKAEAEAKAKAEAESKAKAEAESKAKAEAESKAKAEAEAKAKAEAESKAKAEAESKAKAEAEAKAKAEAEAESKAKEEAEAKAKAEAEEKAKKEAEAKAADEHQKSAYHVSHAEKQMLYRIVQAEAEGEPREGKRLVANVVLNRVRSSIYPNSIEQVIMQPGQFKPVRNGRYNSCVIDADTVAAVDEVLSGAASDNSRGALYFQRSHRKTGHSLISVVGKHAFFR